MRFNYPASLHCTFEDFPQALDVRLGVQAAAVKPGASRGSKVVLRQTPASGFAQGEIAVGSPLPELRMAYSDTGDDADFEVKASFDGVMSLYRENALDTTLRFNACKRIVRHDAAGNEDAYFAGIDCATAIAATSDDPLAFPPAFTVREFIYSNEFDPLPQYIFFYGQWYLFVHNSIIRITTPDNEYKTLTYISMPMFSVGHPYFVVTNG